MYQKEMKAWNYNFVFKYAFYYHLDKYIGNGLSFSNCSNFCFVGLKKMVSFHRSSII